MPEKESFFFFADSLKHAYVDNILKSYGWLDTRRVGKNANLAIFLVVQYAQPK